MKVPLLTILQRNVVPSSAISASRLCLHALHHPQQQCFDVNADFLSSSNIAHLFTQSDDMIVSNVATSSSILQSVAETSFGGVNAWSVNGDSLNSADLASGLFAASLAPYLILLYFLARPQTNTPKLGNFGFQFLLAFVGATIPAGIWAKLHYHDILANVDWLHGSAEALLTITNLLLIAGFLPSKNQYVPKKDTQDALSTWWEGGKDVVVLSLLVASLFTALSQYPLFDTSAISLHSEPLNALSLPTWAVHTSSILEWLVAMKLIWEHGDRSGNPRWKGMTWAMIPSHASGLCACTYHLFYNSPNLFWLVNLQAALTVVGNSCMAYASYRIFQFAKNNPNIQTSEKPSIESDGSSSDLSRTVFWTGLLLKSLILAGMIKYGELYFQFPFDTNSQTALLFILLPTLVNTGKWYSRSQKTPLDSTVA